MTRKVPHARVYIPATISAKWDYKKYWVSKKEGEKFGVLLEDIFPPFSGFCRLIGATNLS